MMNTVYLNKVLCILLLGAVVSSCALAQGGFPNYYRYTALVRQADSLLKIKKYQQAASAFSAALKVPVESGIELPLAELNIQAGSYWAAAAEPDSAFAYLDRAVAIGFADLDTLSRDEYLQSVKSDPRWKIVYAQVAEKKAQLDLQAKVYLERTTFLGDGRQVLFHPPTPWAKKFLFNEEKPFISIDHSSFRIYLRGNSYAAKHLEELKSELKISLQRSFEVLGIDFHRRGTSVIVVDDRAEMKELTGFSVGGGLAVADSDLLFLVWNGTRRIQAKHELFHVISGHAWGSTASRLLNEGAAVYADNECLFKNPIYTVNALFLREKKSVEVSRLITDFDQVAKKGEVVAYLQSAAIFKFLYESYGREKMKLLWKTGFEGFERIYGFSVPELQKKMEGVLLAIPIPKNADIAKLLAEGCG